MSHRQLETTGETAHGSTPAHQAELLESEATLAPHHDAPALVAPRPQAQAAALTQASGGRLARAGHALLQLQRGYGNRYVQEVVQHARQAANPALAPVIQAKMVLGPTDDQYEQEADRVAQQVVGQLGSQGEAVQRQRDEDGSVVRRAPDIQPVGSVEGGMVDTGVQQTIEQARGGGQPLPDAVLGPMEQAFGADLSGVRLHTDAQADGLNRSLQARAFTTGRDIFLRRGEYAPEVEVGRS